MENTKDARKASTIFFPREDFSLSLKRLMSAEIFAKIARYYAFAPDSDFSAGVSATVSFASAPSCVGTSFATGFGIFT